jgi:hypothetical protein
VANNSRARARLAEVEFGVEGRVRQADPAAEDFLQPQRHFRGGGAGEGEALDARRIGAGEHQPQQPVGEQLGLAGAGRGGDEGGDRGIGGGALGLGGAVAGGLAHAPSSRSHSASRSSWA